MKIKRLLAGSVLVMTTLGLSPTTASAASCVEDVEGTNADNKVVGQTCTGCGWVMIRGQQYYLFLCD